MAATRVIDVQDVINSHPVSRFQAMVIALCFLVVAIDGFDTAAQHRAIGLGHEEAQIDGLLQTSLGPHPPR